jgi:repressor LexA
MARQISQRQKLILNYIQQHTESHGYPPTVREIGEAVDLSSSSTVHAHLKALEERGFIKRDAVLTRAIKITQEGMGYVLGRDAGVPDFRTRGIINMPVLGTVAAGKPITAVEDIQDYFPIPENFVNGEGFILQVRGDSMIEDGIHHGDYVVVRRQPTADNGETVVAMIEGEATVKRFYKEKKRIRLEPANRHMKPIFAESPDLLGKVVGLIRRLS